MSIGLVQIWPANAGEGTAVRRTATVIGRAAFATDQGVDKKGTPADGFVPGMDVHARLTVVGDGPCRAGGTGDRRTGLECPKATTSATGRWA